MEIPLIRSLFATLVGVRTRDSSREVSDANKCPYCGELLHTDATKCRGGEGRAAPALVDPSPWNRW